MGLFDHNKELNNFLWRCNMTGYGMDRKRRRREAFEKNVSKNRAETKEAWQKLLGIK